MAIDIQDPRITRTLRTGYPEPIKVQRNKDAFGYTVYPGDEILEFDDVIFLKEELLQEVFPAIPTHR